MAPVVIKLPGKSAAPKQSKATPKRTRTPKPVAKPTPKRTAAKPAAVKAAPAPQEDQRIATDGRILRTPKDIEPKVLHDFEKRLKQVGEQAKRAKEAHDDAIDQVHSVVTEAREASIPMAIIEDTTGISRQWLYKMGQFKDRDTSGSAPVKPAKPKNTPKSTATRAAATANRTARKPAAKRAVVGAGPLIKRAS